MRQRKKSFIVVSLMIFKISLSAQENTVCKPLFEIEKQSIVHNLGKSFPGSFPGGKSAQQVVTPGGKKSLKIFSENRFLAPVKPVFTLSPYRPEAFFCRQELLLEKRFLLPIKFRLGSVNFVDYLEQKPNAINPRH